MRSFVKWAGGKTNLLKEIDMHLPKHFSRMEEVVYVEPFVGGGSVLFHMLSHYDNISKAIINDINEVLMDAYSAIKSSPGTIIDGLKHFEKEYGKLDTPKLREDFYYRTRSLYNSQVLDKTQMVIVFIFLNRTCFNGLYRENQQGQFNVPHGKLVNPVICDEDNILKIHKALQKVEIYCSDFGDVFCNLKEGNHFIYLDPPYRPVNKGEQMFTQYYRSGFGEADQLRLKEICQVFTQKGYKWMLSNSDSFIEKDKSFFEEIYTDCQIDRIAVSRMINSYNCKNRKPTELIITNYRTRKNIEQLFL